MPDVLREFAVRFVFYTGRNGEELAGDTTSEVLRFTSLKDVANLCHQAVLERERAKAQLFALISDDVSIEVFLNSPPVVLEASNEHLTLSFAGKRVTKSYKVEGCHEFSYVGAQTINLESGIEENLSISLHFPNPEQVQERTAPEAAVPENLPPRLLAFVAREDLKSSAQAGNPPGQGVEGHARINVDLSQPRYKDRQNIQDDLEAACKRILDELSSCQPKPSLT